MEVYNGNVFVVRKVFDRAFIDKVIDQHDNSKLGTSYVYTGGSTNVSQADVKARLSMQCDIADDHHITQKVAEVVKQINSNHLHINVSKYCQENHFLKIFLPARAIIQKVSVFSDKWNITTFSNIFHTVLMCNCKEYTYVKKAFKSFLLSRFCTPPPLVFLHEFKMKELFFPFPNPIGGP